MSKDGCPYRQRNPFTGDEYCPVIAKAVEGFVMCELDWENCPEYQSERAKEEEQFQAEISAELALEQPYSEELIGEEYWANAGEE